MENPKPLVSDAQFREMCDANMGTSFAVGASQMQSIYEADRAEKDKTISALQNDLGLVTIDRDHWKRLEASAYTAIEDRDKTIASLREALERLGVQRMNCLQRIEPGGKLNTGPTCKSTAPGERTERSEWCSVCNATELLSTLPKPQL